MKFRYFALVFALLVLVANGLRSFPKVEKESWPETVGMTGEKAKDVVKAECKDCNVIVLNHFSAVTMDLRFDRVRIFVDENNIVKNPPRRG
ncbi:subtilisin inhibitor [Blastocystis sp. subtype 4]|uniref:subtilisin inhibitor n=1 Tax=Blastocystis sp. subtype 4 TaxID=944170 RepID=UPI000711FF76|nr:subtilisin inhibitor [Blastocystis sp. subtype 4]KNB45182.1 subtilisin inhibitor [Blastocystis sp. subtype 4]|eukprot:XP_014528625.1 subtilisin inhibitor [Blastocystis sp. subtype 4]